MNNISKIRAPRVRWVLGPIGLPLLLLSVPSASIASAQTVTSFPAPTARVPFRIVAGPDGNLWFTAGNDFDHHRIRESRSRLPLGQGPAQAVPTLGPTALVLLALALAGRALFLRS